MRSRTHSPAPRVTRALALALALVAAAAGAHPAAATAPVLAAAVAADSARGPLQFAPHPGEDDRDDPGAGSDFEGTGRDEWLRARFGDPLLTDPEEWRASAQGFGASSPRLDYNRVDRLRLGLGYQIQPAQPMVPRVGARLEFAFDRKRVLYGLQIEQPLARSGRLAVGASLVRGTDHSELQQVDDLESSIALLFGRQDYRDYFEREGMGAYVAWRVPDFSTVGLYLRRDTYRSLPLNSRTRSWFARDRALRDNPAIDKGEVHAAALRLERAAHRSDRTRAGVYHWIELERAGDRLGGDFTYARILADVRSVVRLSPATTLALRALGGHTFDGALPFQKQFVVGGVDGLRAHAFGEFRGDQVLLAQAEYQLDVWPLRGSAVHGGLCAIAFIDAGRAWFDRAGRYDLGRQRLAADGGVGIGLSDNRLRVYFARDLQESDAHFLVSVRLQRPF